MSSANRSAKLQSLCNMLSKWFYGIAGVAFLLMMATTFVDVVGAKVFGLPLYGAFDIVALSQVIAIASAIAITQITGRHVRVEIVSNRLPKRAQATLLGFTTLFALGVTALIGWQSFMYGLNLKKVGEASGTVVIPHYPFVFWIGLSCVPMCLVLILEFLNSVAEVVKK